MKQLQVDQCSVNFLNIARTENLASIEYWDEDRNIVQSSIHPDNGWDVKLIETSNKIIWVAGNDEIGIRAKLEMVIYDDHFTLMIPRDGLSERGACQIKSFCPLPGFIAGYEGDGSELVLPINHGCLCRSMNKKPAEYKIPVFAPFAYALMCNMPLWGIDLANGIAVAAIVEGGRFDFSLAIRTCWGTMKRYSADAVFAFRDCYDEKPLCEDITLIYAFIDVDKKEAGYARIAKYYRTYNEMKRNLPTLNKKMEKNEAMQYSINALCLRFRMAVKELPTPILEQKPDHQPPLHVYMTFDDVRTVIEEMARQGVGPTEICLVGWNYAGHDGAFPQLFPVEQALGGEKALRDLIKRSHELGYPLSLHDNYYDAYSLANTFDPDTICQNIDGSKATVSKYAGGQAYKLCAKCAFEKYAVKSLPEVAKLGIKGSYYIDELTLVSPCKCYHEKHPMTRRDTIQWIKRILGEARRYFGAVQSEGGRDWALPELDRVYSVSAKENTDSPFVDECVPLYPVVYHGFLLYNSFRSNVNAFPGDNTYLLNISYGGLPLIYYHHLHNPSWSAAEGISGDLTFEGIEKLRQDVAMIKRITCDIERLAPVQTDYLEEYRQHSPVLSETIFSSGISLYVNYSDVAIELPEGQTIPARDFLVHNAYVLRNAEGV